MLESKKLELRRSEIRQELATLAAKPTPTEDEVRSMENLDREYRTCETRFRAALIAEDTERREAGAELETRAGREFADLVAGFELRQVVLQLDEGRALEGRTAEVVQELRSRGGYRGTPIPLEVLEQRAGETVASGVPSPMTTKPIVDRLFPSAVASRLGVQTINVGTGSTEWPVATAGAVAGWAATEGGNVSGPSAFATAEKSLAPNNTLGAHMRLTRKALKQTAGLEEAVRRDLSNAIGVALDAAVFNGTGADGQPLGIIAGAASYGVTSTAIDAAATWAAIRAEVVAFMEGNCASTPGEVKIGFGPSVWADMDAQQAFSGDSVTELDRLVAHMGAPAVANILGTTAVLTTSAGGIAPAFLGLWGAVDVIRDPFSDAQAGGLRITGLLTADVVVARGSQVRILTGLAGA